MKLYTAHFNYNKPDRIDISVNTRSKLYKPFTPTKEMVLGLRDGTISQEEFTRQYRQMMRESKDKHYNYWRGLLLHPEATLVEFSHGEFKYRVLLAQWLQEWYPRYVQYMGER